MTIQRIVPNVMSPVLADLNNIGQLILPGPMLLKDDGGIAGFESPLPPSPFTAGVNEAKIIAGIGGSVIPLAIADYDNITSASVIIANSITLPPAILADIVQIIPFISQLAHADILIPITIVQSIPFLSQHITIYSETVIMLPDAAHLHTGGSRWKYRFYTTTTHGMTLQAWPGDTIVMHGTTGTKLSCNTVGCFLELFAINDTHVGCSAEQPPGSWTLA